MCQLEKCLKKGKLQMSSCICTDGLKKSLHNLPHQLLKYFFQCIINYHQVAIMVNMQPFGKPYCIAL